MRERKKREGWQVDDKKRGKGGKKAEAISGYGKQVDVRMVGGGGEDAERQQHGRGDAGSGSGAE